VPFEGLDRLQALLSQQLEGRYMRKGSWSLLEVVDIARTMIINLMIKEERFE
jgi:hypothetical protein